MILLKKFLMPKQNFEGLVAELKPYISPNPLSPNQRALQADTQTGVTLHYLKHTVLFGIITNSFNIGNCAVSVVTTDVGGAISKYLEPNFISLPKDKHKTRVEVGEFGTKLKMKPMFQLNAHSKTPKTTLLQAVFFFR